MFRFLNVSISGMLLACVWHWLLVTVLGSECYWSLYQWCHHPSHLTYHRWQALTSDYYPLPPYPNMCSPLLVCRALFISMIHFNSWWNYSRETGADTDAPQWKFSFCLRDVSSHFVMVWTWNIDVEIFFIESLFTLPEILITISPINSTSFANSPTFSLFTLFFFRLLPIVP